MAEQSHQNVGSIQPEEDLCTGRPIKLMQTFAHLDLPALKQTHGIDFLQGKPQHSLWSLLLLLTKSKLGFMFLDESGTLAVFSSRQQDSYSTWSKVLLQLEYSTIRIFNICDRLLTFRVMRRRMVNDNYSPVQANLTECDEPTYVRYFGCFVHQEQAHHGHFELIILCK